MKRKVKTAYFDTEFNVQQINRSVDPNRASINAFGHLQYNTYGNHNVNVAHVYDGETGEVYTEMIRVMSNTPEGPLVQVLTTYKKGDPATHYPRKKRERSPRRSIAILETGLDPITL